MGERNNKICGVFFTSVVSTSEALIAWHHVPNIHVWL